MFLIAFISFCEYKGGDMPQEKGSNVIVLRLPYFKLRNRRDRPLRQVVGHIHDQTISTRLQIFERVEFLQSHLLGSARQVILFFHEARNFLLAFSQDVLNRG